jgi:hypothetical protein
MYTNQEVEVHSLLLKNSAACREKTGWVPQPVYEQWRREELVSNFADPPVLTELSWHTNFTTATTKSCELHEI